MKNVHAALIHIMKAEGDRSLQALKKSMRHMHVCSHAVYSLMQYVHSFKLDLCNKLFNCLIKIAIALILKLEVSVLIRC